MFSVVAPIETVKPEQCFKNRQTETETGWFDRVEGGPVRIGRKTKPVGLVLNRPIRYQTGRFRHKLAGSIMFFSRTPADDKIYFFFCFF
jgi:hypothetical protein